MVYYPGIPEMTEDDIATHLQWTASSGHRAGWRVTRHDYRRPPLLVPHFQEARGRSGRLRLFRSREAAEKVAAQMNREAGRLPHQRGGR